MSARPLLTFVDTRSFVLYESGRGAQAAVRLHRITDDTPARVVGSHDELAARSERNMAGVSTAGRLLVEQRKLSGLRVSSQGADHAGLLSAEVAQLAARVNERLGRVQGEKGRAIQFGGQLDR